MPFWGLLGRNVWLRVDRSTGLFEGMDLGVAPHGVTRTVSADDRAGFREISEEVVTTEGVLPAPPPVAGSSTAGVPVSARGEAEPSSPARSTGPARDRHRGVTPLVLVTEPLGIAKVEVTGGEGFQGGEAEGARGVSELDRPGARQRRSAGDLREGPGTGVPAGSELSISRRVGGASRASSRHGIGAQLVGHGRLEQEPAGTDPQCLEDVPDRWTRSGSASSE